MKNQLTIIAKILAKTEFTELIKDELLKLVESSRTDKGCINYTLLQDNTDLNSFVVYENWENDTALEKHLETDHFKTFTAATHAKLIEFAVNKMTTLS
ncbi:putative quinol monooxygenase [Formosa sp. PL04]|uniref:putative quinol monooxygenase n=1 Tax=Formosa sp. PL04 TaxID=3081755 RepID=UPI002980CAA8|nr:putative quinol monooxygenase [Formosa sp. PL04]MDW5288511.1 putative quinol monooxygenase [Formosa sp. PL04]